MTDKKPFDRRFVRDYTDGLPAWMFVERDYLNQELDRAAMFGDLARMIQDASRAAVLNLYVWAHEAGRMRDLLRAERNRRCADCDAREGSSHYCLVWSINTPDDHYCKDWTEATDD